MIVDISVPTRLSKAEREALHAYAAASGEVVSDGGGILDRVRDALG